jgi:hypothetical protein
VRTKKSKRATKIEPHAGHIQRRRVRCGKSNCRCARGQSHVAYYHVWKSDGVRYQRYIRRADVGAMRRACAEHRALQAELRAGRENYKAMLRRLRDAVALLAGARKAGWL